MVLTPNLGEAFGTLTNTDSTTASANKSMSGFYNSSSKILEKFVWEKEA